MSTTKIALLQRLLDQSSQLITHDSDDPKFKTWKNTVERTLIKLFGSDSPEVKQFRDLRFFYSPLIMSLGADYSREHRQCFDRDFDVLLASIKSYIVTLHNHLR